MPQEEGSVATIKFPTPQRRATRRQGRLAQSGAAPTSRWRHSASRTGAACADRRADRLREREPADRLRDEPQPEPPKPLHLRRLRRGRRRRAVLPPHRTVPRAGLTAVVADVAAASPVGSRPTGGPTMTRRQTSTSPGPTTTRLRRRPSGPRQKDGTFSGWTRIDAGTWVRPDDHADRERRCPHPPQLGRTPAATVDFRGIRWDSGSSETSTTASSSHASGVLPGTRDPLRPEHRALLREVLAEERTRRSFEDFCSRCQTRVRTKTSRCVGTFRARWRGAWAAQQQRPRRTAEGSAHSPPPPDVRATAYSTYPNARSAARSTAAAAPAPSEADDHASRTAPDGHGSDCCSPGSTSKA